MRDRGAGRYNYGRHAGVLVPLDTQQCWNQPRLPVIGMHNVRVESESAGDFQHRPAEEDKAFTVVPEVAIPVEVQAGSVEVIGLIDQVDRHRRAGQRCLPDLSLHVLLADGNGEFQVHGLQVGGRLQLRQFARVVGRDQRHFMPGGGQRFGQRRGNVGQATRLGVGDCFRTGDDNPHRRNHFHEREDEPAITTRTHRGGGAGGGRRSHRRQSGIPRSAAVLIVTTPKISTIVASGSHAYRS